MKFIAFVLIMGIAGYFAFQQFKPKPPPPPPPPPPPAILLEPAPVISPEEQAKVIRSANDQDPNVRWEALIFLQKMGSPEALPLMIEKLHKDPEPDIRKRAIRTVAERKGPEKAEIAKHLVQALRDPEADVRVEVLAALDRLGDYSVASAITDCLKDQEDAVRVQALRTLNSLQDKKAAEIAAEMRRQEELRRQAEEAARQQKR